MVGLPPICCVNVPSGQFARGHALFSASPGIPAPQPGDAALAVNGQGGGLGAAPYLAFDLGLQR